MSTKVAPVEDPSKSINSSQNPADYFVMIALAYRQAFVVVERQRSEERVRLKLNAHMPNHWLVPLRHASLSLLSRRSDPAFL